MTGVTRVVRVVGPLGTSNAPKIHGAGDDWPAVNFSSNFDRRRRRGPNYQTVWSPFGRGSRSPRVPPNESFDYRNRFGNDDKPAGLSPSCLDECFFRNFLVITSAHVASFVRSIQLPSPSLPTPNVKMGWNIGRPCRRRNRVSNTKLRAITGYKFAPPRYRVVA